MNQPEHFTIPHPLLQPYVTAFMHMPLDASAGGFSVDMFPVGYSVLSYSLKDKLESYLDKTGDIARFIITGQLTKHYNLPIKKGLYSYVYAVLKPYGAYRLLYFPQDSVTNTYAPIPGLLGDKVAALCTGIEANSDSPAKVIKLLDEWLLHQLQLKPDPPKMDKVIHACTLIEKSDGAKSIVEICEEVGMSKSSIERHFLEKVGISPKMYSRIVRCTNAYNTIQSGKYQNWQDVVYQYNFYDQAHFIKDFRSFFNRTPAEVHHNSLNSAGLLLPE